MRACACLPAAGRAGTGAHLHGAGAPEPSFNQRSSDVPPLSSEVQARDDASAQNSAKKQ